MAVVVSRLNVCCAAQQQILLQSLDGSSSIAPELMLRRTTTILILQILDGSSSIAPELMLRRTIILIYVPRWQ